MHPHRDMEISTIMLAGSQRHLDSTGGARLLTPGAVQTMSAGRGIAHSEANASDSEPFHSYQIWIYPKQEHTAPRYDTFTYDRDQPDRLWLALSPDGRGGSGRIGQDAFLSVGTFTRGRSAHYDLHAPGNGVYIQCARGELDVAGHRLTAGDAVGVWQTDALTLTAAADAEVVLVEVPMTRGISV